MIDDARLQVQCIWAVDGCERRTKRHDNDMLCVTYFKHILTT